MDLKIAKSFSLLLLLTMAACAFGQAPASPGELTVIPTGKPYHPMTLRQRMHWTVRSTIGAESLTAGVISAGFGTATDRPEEYGTHWEGFAERYGMRLTGVATSNAMEAGLGALWGEDPHYYAVGPGEPLKARVKNIVRATFTARERDGRYAPAYARIIAVPASNFLSNTWRADSESNVHDALFRTFLGFAGHMTRNAWEEFRPEREKALPGS